MASENIAQEKRYFYREPLAAAWMAKRFGMEFNVLAPDRSGDFHLYRYNPNWCLPLHGQCNNLYIHPDSLRLLEPQEGDEGFYLYKMADGNACTRQCYFIDGNWFIEGRSCDLAELPVEIDKRNGIAFIWPERE